MCFLWSWRRVVIDNLAWIFLTVDLKKMPGEGRMGAFSFFGFKVGSHQCSLDIIQDFYSIFDFGWDRISKESLKNGQRSCYIGSFSRSKSSFAFPFCCQCGMSSVSATILLFWCLPLVWFACVLLHCALLNLKEIIHRNWSSVSCVAV